MECALPKVVITLPACLLACLPACLRTCLPAYLPAYLPACLPDLLFMDEKSNGLKKMVEIQGRRYPPERG